MNTATGFSLVEVLVSLALFSSALFGLFAQYATAAQALIREKQSMQGFFVQTNYTEHGYTRFTPRALGRQAL